MAKNKLKPKVQKAASKAGSKTDAKKAKAPAAAAKPAKTLAKMAKAVAKVFAKKEAPKKAPAPAPAGKPAASIAAKTATKPGKVKSGKADKASKKKKTDEIEFEDDLLAGDDDLGSEEIPDLSEFDETEEAVEEPEDDDTDVVEAKPSPDDEVVLLDAEGRRYCRVRDCDQASAVEGYCRFHYLLLWKNIQIRRSILIDGKLERYVEELTARYPDKFLEMIRKDLKTEKDFLAVLAELEIDESGIDNEFEDEAQSYVDEIRGISDTASSMSDDEEF